MSGYENVASIDSRLNMFLDYYITKPAKPTLVTIANECGIDIKGLSVNSIIEKLLTEKPFEVNIQQQSKVSFCTRDDLVLLDKGSFYCDGMKESSRLFHSMANRLESLNSCFVKLKAIKDVADKKFALNGTRNLDGLVEQIDGCVLENMGVKLPFKLEEVRKALSKGEITSAYLQVYLCPLRDHIGKDNKSKTGHLLCSIENEYFKGILGLT